MVSTARIERPPLYRGGSASTETLLAVSPSPSEAVHSDSTGPTWVSFLSQIGSLESLLPRKILTQWDDPNSPVLFQIQHRLIARDDIVLITFFCALQDAVVRIVRQDLDRETRLHELGHFGQGDGHMAQLITIMAKLSGEN